MNAEIAAELSRLLAEAKAGGKSGRGFIRTTSESWAADGWAGQGRTAVLSPVLHFPHPGGEAAVQTRQQVAHPSLRSGWPLVVRGAWLESLAARQIRRHGAVPIWS